MPEMGGIELIQQIKGNDVLSHIPVIFITTESSKVRKDEAAAHGAAGYIQKPFVPETIKTVLLDVLEKAYAQRMQEEKPVVDNEVDEELDF